VGRKLVVRVCGWVEGRRRVWLDNDGKVLDVLIMGFLEISKITIWAKKVYKICRSQFE